MDRERCTHCSNCGQNVWTMEGELVHAPSPGPSRACVGPAREHGECGYCGEWVDLREVED